MKGYDSIPKPMASSLVLIEYAGPEHKGHIVERGRAEPTSDTCSFQASVQGVEILEDTLLRPLGGRHDVEIIMLVENPLTVLVYWALRWRVYKVHLMGPVQPLRGLPEAWRDEEPHWLLGQIVLAGKAATGGLPSADVFELRILTRYLNDLRTAERALQTHGEFFAHIELPTLPERFAEVCASPLTNRRGLPTDPEEVDHLLAFISGELIESLQKKRFWRSAQTFEAALGLLEAAIGELERRLQTWQEPHTAAEYLSGVLPSVLCASLYSEAQPITRFPTAEAFMAFAGLESGRTSSHLVVGSGLHLRRSLRAAAREMILKGESMAQGLNHERAVMRPLTTHIHEGAVMRLLTTHIWERLTSPTPWRLIQST